MSIPGFCKGFDSFDGRYNVDCHTFAIILRVVEIFDLPVLADISESILGSATRVKMEKIISKIPMTKKGR